MHSSVSLSKKIGNLKKLLWLLFIGFTFLNFQLQFQSYVTVNKDNLI